jgi:hypothetical protein
VPVPEGTSPAKGPRRPELLGFAASERRQGEQRLPLAFDAYVELLEASGVALRSAGPGPALPERSARTLERLGIRSELWLEDCSRCGDRGAEGKRLCGSGRPVGCSRSLTTCGVRFRSRERRRRLASRSWGVCGDHLCPAALRCARRARRSTGPPMCCRARYRRDRDDRGGAPGQGRRRNPPVGIHRWSVSSRARSSATFSPRARPRGPGSNDRTPAGAARSARDEVKSVRASFATRRIRCRHRA